MVELVALILIVVLTYVLFVVVCLFSHLVSLVGTVV